MIVQSICYKTLRDTKELLHALLKMGSLDTMYKRMVELAQTRKLPGIIMSCCGTHCTDGSDYSLFGKYTRRKPIIDVRYDESAGRTVVETVENFEIQRVICHHEDGKLRTHALLFDLLVPYKHYSVRAVLHYIMMFAQGNNTISGFCAKHELNIDEFNSWIKWVKTHIPDLLNIGLSAIKNTVELCKQFIELLDKNYYGTYKRLVETYHRSLFQIHKTFANSKRLSGEPVRG